MNEVAWLIAEIIVGIAFLGVLAAVVTAVMVPRLARLGTPHWAAETALDERYARGEVTRDEYAQIRRDLGLGTH